MYIYLSQIFHCYCDNYLILDVDYSKNFIVSIFFVLRRYNCMTTFFTRGDSKWILSIPLGPFVLFLYLQGKIECICCICQRHVTHIIGDLQQRAQNGCNTFDSLDPILLMIRKAKDLYIFLNCQYYHCFDKISMFLDSFFL